MLLPLKYAVVWFTTCQIGIVSTAKEHLPYAHDVCGDGNAGPGNPDTLHNCATAHCHTAHWATAPRAAARGSAWRAGGSPTLRGERMCLAHQHAALAALLLGAMLGAHQPNACMS